VELLLNEQERIEDEIAPLSDETALRRRVTRQIKKRREFRSHLVIYIAINLMFFVFFAALGIPWVAGIIALSWGSGLAAQAIDLYYDTGKRAAARLTRMHQAYRDAYGPHWADDATREQLVRLRQETDGPTQKRSELAQHAAVFVCINLMLWFLYLVLMPESFPWPLLVTGFWGLGLAGHINEIFSKPRSDKAVEAEIERQRALLAEAAWDGEKPKNDFRDAEDEPSLTVGPDGELVELPDDRVKRKRR
jgi:hypothetical protein